MDGERWTAGSVADVSPGPGLIRERDGHTRITTKAQNGEGRIRSDLWSVHQDTRCNQEHADPMTQIDTIKMAIRMYMMEIWLVQGQQPDAGHKANERVEEGRMWATHGGEQMEE